MKQKLTEETMLATLETAKALVAGLAGQAALECFVPQFIRSEGMDPRPVHLEAASRIAAKVGDTFRAAMKEEAPLVRDELGKMLGIRS